MGYRRYRIDRGLHAVGLLAASLVIVASTSCRGTAKPVAGASSHGVIHSELSGKSVSTRPQPPPPSVPRGPFGLSRVSSSDGKPTQIERFQLSQACAECHPRQWRELEGSMHSVAHRDSLYRRTAELARVEAGEQMYAYCSGCHTPQGVTSGLVPDTPEEKLPEVVKAGILCDTCHQIVALSGDEGPWGEPGNASFVLRPDEERKVGPPTGNDEDAEHEVEARDFFQKSEFCASCHTMIHPLNGVRIEHTYAEWKKSIYAQKGIQCQDCHMRTVEQARQVAATLKPITITGQSAEDGEVRPIAHHFFVGGNASADKLGGGAEHARLAAERLKSAARLELITPPHATAGKPLRLEVVVTNIAAGHNLPTSLTELREMWVDLQVKTASGKLVFHSGALDAQGDIDAQAMRFGAHAADKNGKLTYKPWEITHFLWKRLIAPKAAAKDAFFVPLPPGLQGPLTVTAKLYYRSAPPKVVKQLFGDDAVELRTVEMARDTETVRLR